MGLELLLRRTNNAALQRALRGRASDYENEHPTKKELDSRVLHYLNKSVYLFQPPVGPNTPVSSNQWREFLRDSRFFVSLNNLQLLSLEKDINRLTSKVSNNIDRLQKHVDELDSSVVEEETRFYGDYDVVHFNAFSRAKDQQLSLRNRKWLVDPRTEYAFESYQLLHVLHGAGATLPIIDKTDIPLIDAKLVGESTDSGDSGSVLISTSPRNVFLPDKIFRHVIVRREHDSQGRRYKRNQSHCSIQIELAGIQQINYLKFVPAASSSLVISEVSYINESNEEIVLSSVEADTNTGSLYLLEPVRTKFMKLKLTQHAPVTKLGGNFKNEEAHQLNQMLEGISWPAVFPEGGEYIEGRVFDFSVKSIEVGLYQYAGTGIFRSKDQQVTSPAALSVVSKVDSQLVVSDFPSGANTSTHIAVEYYVAADFNHNGHNVLNDVIPVVDSSPVQIEYLPLVGDEARVKLLPDLTYGLTKVRVLTTTQISSAVIEFTTESAHGFVEGDKISVLGSSDSDLVRTYTVRAAGLTEFSFRARNPNAATMEQVSENTTPRVFVYKIDVNETDIVNPPVRVYKDGVLQTIGTGYQINFTSSNNWLSSYPKGIDLVDVLEDARSGKMRIKILSPVLSSVYWVEYKPYSTQWLGKTKLVQLKNSQVVFDKKLRQAHGVFNTIAIMRSNNDNPYVSPLLTNYSLRVRRF